jgi:hypothetical protein
MSIFPDGSPVIGGGFFQQVDLGPVTLNGTVENAYVARYDSSGNVTWAKAVSGSGGSAVSRIAVVGSNVVAAGFLDGQATFGPGEPNQTVVTSAGPYDVFVAVFDGGDGGFLSATLPGLSIDITGVAPCTTDGSFVVAGSTTSAPIEDALFLRFNPNLTLAWSKQTASTSGSGASVTGIGTLPDGSSFVVGTFLGVVTFGAGEANQTTLTATSGRSDSYVARLGPDGSLAWVRYLDGFGAACTGADPDGSILVLGTVSGTATLDPGGADQMTLVALATYDACVARLDSSGTVLSALDLGPGGATAMTTLSDGTILIAGGTQNGPHQVFVAYMTPGGSEIDYNPYLSDPSGQIYSVALAALPDGSAVLGGSFYGADIRLPGTGVLSPANQSEFFLGRFR